MLIKRSMNIEGHRTSIALEPEFWSALETIAKARGLTLVALIAEIDAGRAARDEAQPLASAARIFALQNRA
jgi:predicted DNA-binding ribbon-helix-helix protein